MVGVQGRGTTKWTSKHVTERTTAFIRLAEWMVVFRGGGPQSGPPTMLAREQLPLSSQPQGVMDVWGGGPQSGTLSNFTDRKTGFFRASPRDGGSLGERNHKFDPQACYQENTAFIRLAQGVVGTI